MNTHDSPETSTPQHEPNAVQSRTIWWSGGVLAVLILVSCLLIEGLSLFFARGQPRASANGENPQPPIPLTANLPPLNPDQKAALAELRMVEHTVLSEYAWVDRGAGVARIPLARAMEIVAKSGLPTTIGAQSTSGGQRRD